MTTWVLPVVDRRSRPFPPAEELLRFGVSLKVAMRWQTERRKFTQGLRQRLQDARN